MKNTIIKCVTAILCVVAISVSGMVGVGKVADAKLEGAKAAAEAAPQVSGDATGDVAGDAAGDTSGDVTGDVAGDATGDVAGDVVSDATGDTAGDAAATPSTGDTAATAPSAGTAGTASKVPTGAAEITAYYNNAINKVVNSKAGFNKNRTTVMNTLEGGMLMKLQLVKDMVYDFLGVGSKDWNNAKGKQENLSKASLSASDVTSASCTEKNGVYTITMTLKDGASSANASAKSDTSPLGKSGVYAGQGDKIAFDYKNAENIYTAINGVEDTSAESASQKVTGAKITATVDAKTGNLISLTVTWNWHVDLTTVKYTAFSIKSATGDATTTVKLTNVKW